MDYSAVQIEDNTLLNKLSRPENLRFYNSPLIKKPLAIGRAYGSEEWTTAETDVDMMKPVEEDINDSPNRMWNGFADIRSKQDIHLSKQNMPWEELVDEDVWEEVVTKKGKMKYQYCNNASNHDLLSHYCGLSSE